MSLIKCPECQKEFSDTARNCPHCGYSQRRAAISSAASQSRSFFEENKKGLGIALGIVAAIFILILISNSASNAPYKKYAGTYYSSLAGEGSYSNYPATFVFEEDGTGRYGWKGSWYYFNYTIDGNKVNMEAGLYFEYDGYFTDSGSYKVEDSRGGLTYGKRSDW
ncbi:MAG: hypothetical protein IJE02_04680 [Clostridia bacterium]|nr:hypothetical protein [Clostridia bacterium]